MPRFGLGAFPKVKKIPRPRNLRSKRVDVTREEFNRLIELLNQRSDFIDKNRRDLDVQFTRIASLQAEVDEIKRILKKLALV
jgi:hypothetical protein